MGRSWVVATKASVSRMERAVGATWAWSRPARVRVALAALPWALREDFEAVTDVRDLPEDFAGADFLDFREVAAAGLCFAG